MGLVDARGFRHPQERPKAFWRVNVRLTSYMPCVRRPAGG